MCTCPNYIAYKGTRFDGKEKFVFLGHHEYSKLKKDYQSIPFIEVPCGKCLECRVQRSRAWADRCVLEARNSPFNYFITLTYDPLFIGDNCLRIEDVQLFMKRLRKRFPKVKMKYLACGEYGSNDLRKHYHIAVFNLPLFDLEHNFYKLDSLTVKIKRGVPDWKSGKEVCHYPSNINDNLFSRTIFECWHKQGIITVSPFRYERAAYVAHYIVDKLDGNFKNKWKEVGLTEPFMTMSQGIGKNAYDDDLVMSDQILVERSGECLVSHSPRYFDKLFQKKYGEDIFHKTVSKNRARSRIRRRGDPNDNKKDLINEKRARKMKDKLFKKKDLSNF